MQIPDPQAHSLYNTAFLAFGGCSSETLSQAQITGLGELYILWHFLCFYSLRIVFLYFTPCQNVFIFSLNRGEEWLKNYKSERTHVHWIHWILYYYSPTRTNEHCFCTPFSTYFILPRIVIGFCMSLCRDKLLYGTIVSLLEQLTLKRCQWILNTQIKFLFHGKMIYI